MKTLTATLLLAACLFAADLKPIAMKPPGTTEMLQAELALAKKENDRLQFELQVANLRQQFQAELAEMQKKLQALKEKIH